MECADDLRLREMVQEPLGVDFNRLAMSCQATVLSRVQ